MNKNLPEFVEMLLHDLKESDFYLAINPSLFFSSFVELVEEDAWKSQQNRDLLESKIFEYKNQLEKCKGIADKLLDKIHMYEYCRE